MRLVILFLIYSIGFAHATDTYAQNAVVSIDAHNQRVEEILKEIENQSEFDFFFNNKHVDLNRRVSVSANKGNIFKILEEMFAGTNVKYSVLDKKIILSTNQLNEITQDPVMQIKGVVRDVKGEPLIGVNVKVKGTPTGTVTDLDGKFTLHAKKGTVLEISYVGYVIQEVKVVDTKNLTVALLEDTKVLNEVVVTALGIRKEAKSLSYNVQQLSGADINKVSDANFVNNLNGKIAGVTINSSSAGVGGSSRVVMRGVKSISGNNNALYVIDGIPMPNLSTGQPSDIFEGAGQTGDGISNINPEDIESISVLSGPSAAALYGSSASNGVVLVTTKKGQAERLSINVTNSTTFSAPLILPKFQNSYGPSEDGSYYSWGEKLTTPSSYDPSDFFQHGVNVTNSVSLSTGTERNQTYLSLGTTNANGIIHNNDYARYNASVRNTSSFFNNKMTLDLGFMLSSVKEQNMTAQGQYFNPLIPIYLFPAGDDFSKTEIYQRYDASRNLQVQYWPYGDQGLSMQNPYWITEKDNFVNHKNRYMANATLKYEFADWINLSGRIKMDQSNEKYEKKFNASTNTMFASENGYYSLNQMENRQIYGEALLNINKYFGEQTYSLTANIGGSFENIEYDQNMYGGKLKGVANLFSYNNINPSLSEATQSSIPRKKQSVFASAQVGYKSRVYLDVTARNDWPSTLAGSDTRSFFYPAVGLSGIITDIFNCGTEIMPYMKVRVSYSEVGNEPSPFLTIPTYSLANGYPVTQTRMPNTNLKPEKTKSWEAGVNFVFFQNKLKVDATFYNSRTYNQFFEPTLSSSSGYTSVVVNAGRVDNKGLEVSARFEDTFGEFRWSSYLTYSLNRNKIVELLPGWTNPVTGEVVALNEIDMGGTNTYKMKLKTGGSMGDIYVNTLRTDEHGAIYVHPSDQVVVADANNFVYAGNSNPKYNLGWGNTFSYKGLSLGFLFTARVGGIVVSNTQAIMDAFGASKASADARDAGGALVNGKRIPAKEYYQTVGGGGSGGIGSMYCYSATNVRLGELTLGYDVPINKWCHWIRGLNVSFIGRNLFFLYNKAPYDPELTANTGTYYQGIDYFMLPSLRNLGFSVKLRF